MAHSSPTTDILVHSQCRCPCPAPRFAPPAGGANGSWPLPREPPAEPLVLCLRCADWCNTMHREFTARL